MNFDIHTQWENYCLNVVEMKLGTFFDIKQNYLSEKIIENDGAYPLPDSE